MQLQFSTNPKCTKYIRFFWSHYHYVHTFSISINIPSKNIQTWTGFKLGFSEQKASTQKGYRHFPPRSFGSQLGSLLNDENAKPRFALRIKIFNLIVSYFIFMHCRLCSTFYSTSFFFSTFHFYRIKIKLNEVKQKVGRSGRSEKKQLKFRSKTFRNAVTAKNLLDEIVAKIIILHFLRIFSLPTSPEDANSYYAKLQAFQLSTVT